MSGHQVLTWLFRRIELPEFDGLVEDVHSALKKHGVSLCYGMPDQCDNGDSQEPRVFLTPAINDDDSLIPLMSEALRNADAGISWLDDARRAAHENYKRERKGRAENRNEFLENPSNFNTIRENGIWLGGEHYTLVKD